MTEPFTIAATDEELDELRTRLRATRFPHAETVDDWSQGIPLSYVKELVHYWAEEYDWRAREARLNRFTQIRTEVDGLGIHAIHVRSPHEDALPLVITHGWPGSIVEFHKIIEPLTNPTAHGGDAADAFHVVCPAIPGYGFSDKPTEPGTGISRVADLWAALMSQLGYTSYGAQGGDWGAMVTTALGQRHGDHCVGIHLNMAIAMPTPESMESLTDQEQDALAGMGHYDQWDSGYSKQQSTRPQTLGYGLADSPAGQLAWIVEKFWSWTDNQGHPEDVLTRDELLDNVMLYWLTNSGASSARMYWESFRDVNLDRVECPTGIARFPKEIFRPSRRWAEARYNLLHFTDMPRGGHFAAFEQPELLVDDIRKFFRLVR
jgi:epoxide hydrolase